MRALHTPIPGFSNPVLDAQSAFRIILDAMARPGRIATLKNEAETPESLAPATSSICLCLLDKSTSVWLAPTFAADATRAFLTFHTGCTITEEPHSAGFAICGDDCLLSSWESCNLGSPEYPDRSTTVLVQVDGLSTDGGVRLSGPGIDNEQWLKVDGVTADFWQLVAANNALFPLGADFILVSGNQIVGLPRSARVEI